MKKFKPNKLTTFMFMMLEFLAPYCVGIPIMILLTGNGKYPANEVIRIIPAFFMIFVLIIIIFCCALNLVTLPFTKYTVFLFDDHFSRKNTDVRYNDVTRIEIDSGFIGRYSADEPCCLDCYSGNELLISIEHPSLLMSFLVIHRCKNAKLRYKRVKKLVFLWTLCLICSIVLGLFGARGT